MNNWNDDFKRPMNRLECALILLVMGELIVIAALILLKGK